MLGERGGKQARDIQIDGVCLPKQSLNMICPAFLGVAEHQAAHGRQEMNSLFCFDLLPCDAFALLVNSLYLRPWALTILPFQVCPWPYLRKWMSSCFFLLLLCLWFGFVFHLSIQTFAFMSNLWMTVDRRMNETYQKYICFFQFGIIILWYISLITCKPQGRKQLTRSFCWYAIIFFQKADSWISCSPYLWVWSCLNFCFALSSFAFSSFSPSSPLRTRLKPK